MISVVVCTYNRSGLLAKCLKSLIDQSLSKKLYEVIVADNNSTDDTVEIVQQLALSEPSIGICNEVLRGANHARNAGARKARGEYLAFIDDDAVAYPDWLEKMHCFISKRPEVAAFGGPYEAYSSALIPPWFPPGYGSLSLGDEERPIVSGREWITGTNLVVKKDAFFRVGGFHPQLGIVKNGIFYFGEESRLLVDLARKGQVAYYVPSMKVKHLIREEKLHFRYLLRSYYLMGRNHSLTVDAPTSLSGLLLSLLVLHVKGIGIISSPCRGPFKRRLFYGLFPVFYQAGALMEKISVPKDRQT